MNVLKQFNHFPSRPRTAVVRKKRPLPTQNIKPTTGTISIQKSIMTKKMKIITCMIHIKNKFICGSWDQMIRVYSDLTFKCHQVIREHQSCISALCEVDNDMFISSDNSFNVFTWKMDQCSKYQKIYAFTSNVLFNKIIRLKIGFGCSSVHSTDAFIYSNSPNFSLSHSLKVTNQVITSIVAIPSHGIDSEETLVSASSDRVLSFWSINKKEKIKQIENILCSTPNSLIVLAKTSSIAIGSKTTLIIVSYVTYQIITNIIFKPCSLSSLLDTGSLIITGGTSEINLLLPTTFVPLSKTKAVGGNSSCLVSLPLNKFASSSYKITVYNYQINY